MATCFGKAVVKEVFTLFSKFLGYYKQAPVFGQDPRGHCLGPPKSSPKRGPDFVEVHMYYGCKFVSHLVAWFSIGGLVLPQLVQVRILRTSIYLRNSILWTIKKLTWQQLELTTYGWKCCILTTGTIVNSPQTCKRYLHKGRKFQIKHISALQNLFSNICSFEFSKSII